MELAQIEKTQPYEPQPRMDGLIFLGVTVLFRPNQRIRLDWLRAYLHQEKTKHPILEHLFEERMSNTREWTAFEDAVDLLYNLVFCPAKEPGFRRGFHEPIVKFRTAIREFLTSHEMLPRYESLFTRLADGYTAFAKVALAKEQNTNPQAAA